MIAENTLNETMMQVELLMKDGRKKYGVILDPSADIKSYKFVCNSNIKDFEYTGNQGLIEFIPLQVISSIDTHMK